MEEQQQSTPMDMQQTLNTLVTQMAKLDAKMDANIAELTASIGNSNVEFKAGKAELISKLRSARVRSFEVLFARALKNKQAAERKSMDMLSQTIFEDIWPRIEPVLTAPKRTPRRHNFTPVLFTGGMEIFSPSPQPILTSVDIYLPPQQGNLVLDDCLIAGLTASDMPQATVSAYSIENIALLLETEWLVQKRDKTGDAFDATALLLRACKSFRGARNVEFNRGLFRPYDVWCSNNNSNNGDNSIGNKHSYDKSSNYNT